MRNIRINLMGRKLVFALFMLCAFLSGNLFGHIDAIFINPCPVEFDYICIPLDGTFTYESRFVFSYTISLVQDRVTKYDKQRTYSLSSEFFSKDKNYGSLRTMLSDIQNGDTFTYDQFPVTGHLIVKYQETKYIGISMPVVIDIDLVGYAVEGCPDTSLPEGDKLIQQSSGFSMGIKDQ